MGKSLKSLDYYEELLELTMDLAYEIQCCGAETYRVEDTVTHVLSAYGIQPEVFVIPNCIITSIRTPDGLSLNRMRRSRGSSNNLEGVEKYSALSRELCRDKPSLEDFRARLKETKRGLRHYGFWIGLLGHALAAAGFSVYFGGTWMDCIVGGCCGVAVGVMGAWLGRFHTNVFFQTVASSFVLALVGYVLLHAGLGSCLDAVLIGTIMLLVPGLLFTNSVRDIIYGDSMSGVNRLVQVIIISIALAVGIAAGATFSNAILGTAVSAPVQDNGFIAEVLGCLVATVGFCIVFNLHGPGIGFCLIGTALSWGTYSFCELLGASEIMGYLVAAALSAIFAETMARIRRYPSTPYLIMALLPLIPGSAIYYSMVHAVAGEMDQFIDRISYTAALAGTLAVGILLASTLFRLLTVAKMHRQKALGK